MASSCKAREEGNFQEGSGVGGELFWKHSTFATTSEALVLTQGRYPTRPCTGGGGKDIGDRVCPEVSIICSVNHFEKKWLILGSGLGALSFSVLET